MSQNIIDVTEENAQQVIIDGSHEKLVVVDFWAEWCAPCKVLMPILEKLAAEYENDVILVRVNVDEQQMLSAQFGVRSLPTVMFLKDGQPVDGFMGAQPESAVRELFDKHLPKPWDSALIQAQALIADGKFTDALPVLREAYSQSQERVDIALVLAETMIELGRSDEAEQILDGVSMVDQNADYERLRALLTLKQEAAQTPELKALIASHEANPEDKEIAYQLALQYSQNGQQKEALELLMGILRKDLGFQEGAAKTAMMDIIAALGKGDPLAVEYQRKVYTLLY